MQRFISDDKYEFDSVINDVPELDSLDPNLFDNMESSEE